MPHGGRKSTVQAPLADQTTCKSPEGARKLGGLCNGCLLYTSLLANIFLTPMLARAQVTDVDYGTFMSMIEEKNIGSVEVEDSQILFTDKDNTEVYRTGAVSYTHLQPEQKSLCTLPLQ